MSLEWQNSPAAEATIKVLSLLLPNQVAHSFSEVNRPVRVFSYRSDFTLLWGAINNHNELAQLVPLDANQETTLVIVWDDLPPPDPTIAITKYISPLDWVFALTWAILGDDNGPTRPYDNLPHLRVHIIDLCSKKYPEAFGYQQFKSLASLLPWVQIYSPTQQSEEAIDKALFVALDAENSNGFGLSLLRSIVRPGFFGTETLWLDILFPRRTLSLKAAMSKERLSSLIDLKQLWKNNLAKSGNRHQVANLLGAMIIAKGLPTPLSTKAQTLIDSEYPIRKALGSLITVVGLDNMPNPVPSDILGKGLLAEYADKADFFSRYKRIRFLLLDDQYLLGYHHILGCLLFGENYAPPANTPWEFRLNINGFEWTLICKDSIHDLLSVLRDKGDVSDWKLPRLFDPGADVILLDLRFWAEIGSNQQKSLLNEIINTCKSLGASSFDDATHFAKAFEQARKVVIGEDASEIRALVLLPLLLSYFDPSLPIIIFSSSQQREVLEMVAHRRNIITYFAKPLLSGYGEEVSSTEIVEDLVRAISDSIKLHETRYIWERVVSFKLGPPPVFAMGQPGVNQSQIPVYNLPARHQIDSSLASKYYNAREEKLLAMSSNNLKKRIASDYINYILGERFFDYTSIPWEILEGGLCSKYLSENTWVNNTNFALDDRLDPRNSASRVLEYIRNKKTHGAVRQIISQADVEGFRLAALIEFLCFLDFIENKATTYQSNFQLLADRAETHLRIKYNHLSSKTKNIEPHRLKFDFNIKWFDFVVFIAASAVQSGVIHQRAFLDLSTIRIIDEVTKHLIQTYSQRNQPTIGAIEKGKVLKNIGEDLFVLLDNSLAPAIMADGKYCPNSISGSPIQVRISRNGPLFSEAEEINNDSLLINVPMPKSGRSPTERNIESCFTQLNVQASLINQNRRRLVFEVRFANHESAHQALNKFWQTRKTQLLRGASAEWS